MRRKPLPQEPIIDKKLLEQAKQTIQTDRLKRDSKCVVCNSTCAPNSSEGLCWVCRRLKISAWRDSDQQVVQE